MNISVSERLDFWTCFFLDSTFHVVLKKPVNKEELPASVSPYGILDKALDLEEFSEIPYRIPSGYSDGHNYTCKAHGVYLSGSKEAGRAICILICTLILIIGLFGFITNILNVILLRKTFPGKGPVTFKESLVFLAVVELTLCVAIIGFSFFVLLISENISRTKATIYIFQLCNHISTITRTMSVYTTILITFERYLVIAFPVKSKEWFYNQPWKSRIILLSVVIFCFLINFPWMIKSSIVENGFRDGEIDYEMRRSNGSMEILVTEESHELMDFPYIIKRNRFAKNFNRGLQETLLAVDFVVPFPVLMISNILLFGTIHIWNKKRAALSGRQKRDIKTAKMFSVVVIILLSCYSVSCAVFVTSRILNISYRELLLLQSFVVCTGASANFMVYYWFGPAFQREFWASLKLVFGNRLEFVNRHYQKFRKDSAEMSQGSVNQ